MMGKPFVEFFTIGDIADVKGGKRLPKGMAVQNKKTSHPYLRVVDFNDDGLNRSNVRYISDDAFVKIKRYTISSNDVYISIAGTIGRVGIVSNDLSGANLTENAAKISNISGDINKIFLMYYLRSYLGQSDIASKIVGTSQPKLALFRIKELKVPKVPLPTQRKIASVLSAYDDLIENNLRRIKILEEMAQNLYCEWFVKFRFPGHEKARFVDCSLGRIPEGWKSMKIAALLETIKRKKKIKKQVYRNSGEIPVVDQSKDFVGGFTSDRDALHEDPLPIIVFGDHTRILKFIDFPFASGADGTQLLRSNTTKMPMLLFFHVLKAIELSNYAYARHFKFLKEQEVLVPDKNMANVFSEFVDPFRGQIRSLIQRNTALRRTRDLLLPKLISGELDVSDLDIAVPDEVAA